MARFNVNRDVNLRLGALEIVLPAGDDGRVPDDMWEEVKYAIERSPGASATLLNLDRDEISTGMAVHAIDGFLHSNTSKLGVSWISAVYASTLSGQVPMANLPTGTTTATIAVGSHTHAVTGGMEVHAIDGTYHTGQLGASFISAVAASSLTGQVSTSAISAVPASTLTGSVAVTAISAVMASTISGTIPIANIPTGVTSATVSLGTHTHAADTAIHGIDSTYHTGQIGTAFISAVPASVLTGSVALAAITGVYASVLSGKVLSGSISAVPSTATVPASTLTGSVAVTAISAVYSSVITPAIVQAKDTTLSTVASSGSSVAINFDSYRTWKITLTAASVALSLATVPAGAFYGTIHLTQDSAGSRLVGWPGAITWESGSAPTLSTSAGSVDIISLVTIDGGASWIGASEPPASGGMTIHAIGGTYHTGQLGASFISQVYATTLSGSVPFANLPTGTTSSTVAIGNHGHSATAALAFVIDGGGSVIETGVKGDLQVPFACTITEWTILLDQSGSITVDIWKDTYANYPPTDADSITASATPSVTTATKNTSSTLTGWTTSISAGDTLRYNVDSVTTATRATVLLKVTKTI